MLVGKRMVKNVIVAYETAHIDETLKLMRDNKVRRLPVLDKNKKLVGIVSEKDLLYASPSPVTSLSVYEIQYLLARLTIKEVMTKDVITVEEDTLLEEAARIMADKKIGALPVMRGDKVVGIITETTIFKIFLEMLGARSLGLRLTMLVPEKPGELAKITAEITRLGGDIISLGTFLGEDPTTALLAIKVRDVKKDELTAALKALDTIDILDVREA